MKAEKLREETREELLKKLADLESERHKLGFASAKGELKNPLKKRWVRRDIARILTLLSEKENKK